jgi:sporulation protein YlmC with PRC-barrel domain
MWLWVVFINSRHESSLVGGTVQTDIDPRSLIGRRALDRDGTRIGTVDEVYLDDATGVPEWAAVRTGLFTRDAFVPLEPSELVDDELRVPFKKALIKDAPDFGVGRHLSPEQELQLYHHYGMDVPRSSAEPARHPEGDFGTLAGDE